MINKAGIFIIEAVARGGSTVVIIKFRGFGHFEVITLLPRSGLGSQMPRTGSARLKFASERPMYAMIS